MPIQKNKTKALGFLLFLSFLPLTLQAQAEDVQISQKKQFLVTAYYSPMPDQSFYIRGSFEADQKLNGQGTHGADGTPVFPGMLAAPASYPFGTKIYIPGLGVGQVSDRGGAIISKEGYDRIDVWMGQGEEGLSRALNWGSRLVEGEVYDSNAGVEVGFDYSWVNSKLPEGTVKNLQAKASPKEQEEDVSTPDMALEESSHVSDEDQNKADLASPLNENSVLSPGLGRGAEGEKVKKLQSALKEVGYFQANLTGVYDQETSKAVLRFQKDRGVVKSESDLGAGYFGPKTHQVLLSSLNQNLQTLESKKNENNNASSKLAPAPVPALVPAAAPLPSISALSLPERLPSDSHLDFEEVLKGVPQPSTESSASQVAISSSLEGLKLSSQGEAVLRLQHELIKMGFLSPGLDTGYFGAKTQEALAQFQLKKGIITSELEANAGVVNSKTLKALGF